jgi:hypothetical protein
MEEKLFAMVTDEINNLIKRMLDIKKYINIIESIEGNDYQKQNKLEELKYQEELIILKFKSLEKISSQPEYFRLVTMSDIEIENTNSKKEKEQDSREIRLRKLSNEKYMKIEDSRACMELTLSDKVMASVAGDYSKANKLALLLSFYNMKKSSNDVRKNEVVFCDEVPSRLKFLINGGYNRVKVSLKNIERINETIEAFQNEFDKKSEEFFQEFTRNNILGLYEKKILDDEKDITIDIPFFKQHINKIDSSKLENLESLIKNKEKFSRRFFFRKSVKEELKVLNHRINFCAKELYGKIMNWYQMFDYGALGIDRIILFKDIDNDLKMINSSNNTIRRMKSEILDFKGEISYTKNCLESDTYSNIESLNDTLSEIKEVTAVNFSNEKISFKSSESLNKNMEYIMNAVVNIYIGTLLKKVLDEAQKASDEKEAELLCITLYELLEQKNNSVSFTKNFNKFYE